MQSRGYAFQIELTYHAARAGLEIVEIPIVFRERRHGRSKMSPAIALEAMWRVPLMRMGTLQPPGTRPRRARLDERSFHPQLVQQRTPQRVVLVVA